MSSKKISELIGQHRPDLASYESLYKHFHVNPELSWLEKETAAEIKSRLEKLNAFKIHPNVGGTHGLAAVLENGAGTCLLLRADIDALPVNELTGLEYASKKRMKNEDGVEKPVMHACGHDMHITGLLAAAELLVKVRDKWSGTLILCFQPAEERGAGAKAMVEREPKLYDLVPTPDLCIGGHVMPHRAGVIGTRRGLMACAADSYRITLYGRAGHGSQPHRTIDPVVMAASTVMRLQTIVSREVNPSDSAVVTVGAINAGDVENIITDKAELKLDIRSIEPATRERVIKSVRRIVDAECIASNAPKKAEFVGTREFPFTFNDVDVTEKIESTFDAHFGTSPHNYDPDIERLAGSEDFGVLATAINKPACFFVYGGIDPDTWDKAWRNGTTQEDIPVNHSGYFAPVIQPTLKVAVDAYAGAALTWLIKS